MSERELSEETIKTHIKQCLMRAEEQFLIIGLLLKTARDERHWDLLNQESFQQWVAEASPSWAKTTLEPYRSVHSYIRGLVENGFVIGALCSHLYGLPDWLVSTLNNEEKHE